MKRYVKTFILTLFALSWTHAASAQVVSVNDLSRLEAFKTANPGVRSFGDQYFDGEGFFEQEGTANFLYGVEMATGDSALASGLSFCEQIDGIYVEEAGELVPGEQFGALWDADTNSHRFTTFRFQQSINGIPVFQSGVGVLVRNEPEFPVVMASPNLKELQGFSVPLAPGNAAEAVTADAIENVTELLDSSAAVRGAKRVELVLDGNKNINKKPVEIENEEWVVWAGTTNVKVEPELAVRFTATRGSLQNLSALQRHLVIAAVDDGEILYSRNEVWGDIDGTVAGVGSPEGGAAECLGPQTFNLPYARIEVPGQGDFFADVNGAFSIPDSGANDLLLRSHLEGQFFSVVDVMGAGDFSGDVPSIEMTVNSSKTADFLYNESQSEFGAAAVNGYVYANIARDFVLSYDPQFPSVSTQDGFGILANSGNLAGMTSCNAAYVASFNVMIFMRNAGECNNTSFSDIVYHEYGHHVHSVTGNTNGQFGEGFGDVLDVLIEDDPDLGRGFFESSCSDALRSANNFRTFPCVGSIHDCGQLLSGCIWDCRNEIGLVDPENARDITAELTFAMLIVRGQLSGAANIGPEISTIFLQLNDDDGTLENGTPLYTEIGTAFHDHNMLTVYLKGDINRDVDVGLLDVAPFVEVLTSGEFQEEADINGDGAVNLLDVAPFVELLTGS